MKINGKRIGALLASLCLSGWLLWTFSMGSATQNPEGREPLRQVITQVSSPSLAYTAKVLFNETLKNYSIAIEGPGGLQMIIDREIIRYQGYHPPIITLEWKNDYRLAIDVDHDFGEGNDLFEVDLKQWSVINVSMETSREKFEP